jgi:succinoglycan biosynthesis protein ExoA
MSTAPFISVIVPVKNEARSLPVLLTSLVRQEYPQDAFEVIVADGRSMDNTCDVVRTFATQSPVAITIVDNPGIRSGPGRNAGLAAARGELIVFVDGHCKIPSALLLHDTATLFAQTHADCLCRPQPLLVPVDSAFGAAVALVRASALGHGRDSLIYDMASSGFVDPSSAGASYRRSVFNTIGIYDEHFDACEDVELNTRVRKSGMKAYTDPRLAVYYEPRTSISALMKQMIRYGRGRLRLMRKHHDCISAAQIAPAVLVALIAAAVAACIMPAPLWLRLPLCAPVLLYFAVVLASSFNLARTHGGRLFFRASAIFCTIHLGLGFGLWAEALTGVWK